MKQQTLAIASDQNAQYEQYRQPTRRDTFLATMEQIMPWAELCSVIEPHYPKAGNGRPPVGLERMLRMYPSWTPPSSARPVRPRTQRTSVTRRCTTRACVATALANIFLARKRLLA